MAFLGLRHSSLIAIGVVLAVTALATPVGALDIPKAPPLDAPIVDQTNTLTKDQLASLSSQITASRAEKSYELGILIIPTLGNSEDIDGYSIKVAREWGIGEKDKDNGVLLLIVKEDRKLRIEVGRGLEGSLTDLRSSQIRRNVITPKFQKNDYYQGISDGINSIQLAVENKPDPIAERDPDALSMGDLIMFGLVAIPMLFVWLAAILGRTKSWWLGGVLGGVSGLAIALIAGFAIWSVITLVLLIPFGFLFDLLVSRNFKQHLQDGSAPSWWAGGTHFGGGGGGFGGGGSFGGGGFGGGGSSGSW